VTTSLACQALLSFDERRRESASPDAAADAERLMDGAADDGGGAADASTSVIDAPTIPSDGGCLHLLCDDFSGGSLAPAGAGTPRSTWSYRETVLSGVTLLLIPGELSAIGRALADELAGDRLVLRVDPPVTRIDVGVDVSYLGSPVPIEAIAVAYGDMTLNYVAVEYSSINGPHIALRGVSAGVPQEGQSVPLTPGPHTLAIVATWSSNETTLKLQVSLDGVDAGQRSIKVEGAPPDAPLFVGVGMRTTAPIATGAGTAQLTFDNVTIDAK